MLWKWVELRRGKFVTEAGKGVDVVSIGCWWGRGEVILWSWVYWIFTADGGGGGGCRTKTQLEMRQKRWGTELLQELREEGVTVSAQWREAVHCYQWELNMPTTEYGPTVWTNMKLPSPQTHTFSKIFWGFDKTWDNNGSTDSSLDHSDLQFIILYQMN
jgi:hypothetical protein